MRFFKVFLFYYALIVTTVLILVSYFILPKPQNIATAALLSPVAFLFWIYATDPSSVTASKWSARFLMVVFLFSTLGIFSYFLSAKYLPKSAPIIDPTLTEIRTSLADAEAKNSEFRALVSEELGNIKDEIAALQNLRNLTLGASADIDKLIAEETKPTVSAGKITIKDSAKSTVNVYESNTIASKVIGTTKLGVNYSFFESRGDWYLIEGFETTTTATRGWVKAEFFKEIAENQ